MCGEPDRSGVPRLTNEKPQGNLFGDSSLDREILRVRGSPTLNDETRPDPVYGLETTSPRLVRFRLRISVIKCLVVGRKMTEEE